MRLARLATRSVQAVCVAGLVLVALTLVPSLRADDGVTHSVDSVPSRPEVRQAPGFDVVLRLQAELAASTAKNPDYPVDAAQAALVVTAPQAYTLLGRITSEAIGLDAGYAAGVHPSVLERGPELWPGTATPGQPGNAVLSGHRTTHTHPFADLERLTPGDPVTITGNDGRPVTFRVTETAIVPAAEYLQFVLAPLPDPATRQLTLSACHPEGDRTHRIVVRATT